MQLFSIGIDERNASIKDMLIENLTVQDLDEVIIDETEHDSMLYLNYGTKCDITPDCLADVSSRICACIADSVSHVVYNKMRDEIVNRIIEKEYFYFDAKERDEILKGATSIMEGSAGIKYARPLQYEWRSIIKNRIIEYFYDNSELILDGFIRFRLKDFIGEIENAVDLSVDNLLIEKEYNEFIKLLRYFVEIQEPKIEEVHVLLGGEKKYTLLDSGFRVINNDLLEDLAKEISEKDISYDDLLISSLITIAPNKIIIHDSYKIKNTELLNTINNVFQGKVEIKN